MDVKRNMRGELFVAITESKKVQERDSDRFIFEKHKIFLYKEDFDRFVSSLSEVVSFIRSNTQEQELEGEDKVAEDDETATISFR